MLLYLEPLILLFALGAFAFLWVKKPGMAKNYLRGAFYTACVFYILVISCLVYLRYNPPPFTMVQIQKYVESYFEDEPYSRRYRFIPLSHVSDDFIHAAIIGEDPGFYYHSGIAWQALIVKNRMALRSGEPLVGASTVTQQLVKNLFLVTYRSYLRKSIEFTITPLAELILPKTRILELYVNIVEWDRGIFGIKAAAQHHFGVLPRNLTRAQAARLVAVLPAPRVREPADQDSTSARILRRMALVGW